MFKTEFKVCVWGGLYLVLKIYIFINEKSLSKGAIRLPPETYRKEEQCLPMDTCQNLLLMNHTHKWSLYFQEKGQKIHQSTAMVIAFLRHFPIFKWSESIIPYSWSIIFLRISCFKLQVPWKHLCGLPTAVVSHTRSCPTPSLKQGVSPVLWNWKVSRGGHPHPGASSKWLHSVTPGPAGRAAHPEKPISLSTDQVEFSKTRSAPPKLNGSP